MPATSAPSKRKTADADPVTYFSIACRKELLEIAGG